MFLQALIETHDDVASKNYEVLPPEAYPLITGETILPLSVASLPYSSSATNLTQDAVRMVGIRKTPEESLVMLSVSLKFVSFLSTVLVFLRLWLVMRSCECVEDKTEVDEMESGY